MSLEANRMQKLRAAHARMAELLARPDFAKNEIEAFEAELVIAGELIDPGSARGSVHGMAHAAIAWHADGGWTPDDARPALRWLLREAKSYAERVKPGAQ